LTFLPSLPQKWIRDDARSMSILASIAFALGSIFAYLELKIFVAASEKDRRTASTLKFAIAAALCVAGALFGALVVTAIVLLFAENWIRLGEVAFGIVFAIVLLSLAAASAASFVYQRNVRGIEDVQAVWRGVGRTVLQPLPLPIFFAYKCAIVWAIIMLTAIAFGREEWFRTLGAALPVAASVALTLIGTLASYFWMRRQFHQAGDAFDTLLLAIFYGPFFVYLSLGALALCALG